MEEKITIRLFFMGILSAILAVVLTGTAFHNSFTQQVETDLQQTARVIAKSYAFLDQDSQLHEFASDEIRLTLIAPNGDVLFESDADAEEMDNHLDRPEVSQALEEGTGWAMRSSKTLVTDEYYYAVKLSNGSVLRVSIESDEMYTTFMEAYPMIIGLFLVVMVLAVVLAVLLTRKLLKPIKHMAGDIDNLEIIRDEKKVYKELVPFVQEIQAQRIQIEYQMQQIEQEKNKLAAIIENMSEGLLVLDMHKNVMVANESARILLGCAYDMEGENLFGLSNLPELRQAVREAMAGESRSCTLSLNGRQIQLMSNPVISDGEQEGIICLILDVTEKEQIERMKREFTANVSHELKTPLTSISGYAEMIENGMAQPDDIKGFAARIHKESHRLLSLISDIIQLSELDEPQHQLDMEPVDLLEIATETADTLSESANRHQVALSVEGEPSMVTGNVNMLSELIYNLCDNAIRYNKPGGLVKVSVAGRTVTVSDTGIGIPEKYQSRIFERFYRVDKSRSKETGGTGLGLAIVKHIAEQHRARIELNSTENEGTQIKVIFPEV